MATRSQFDRFVSAVHRRAVVMAIVERVGLALAAAAGVACVLAMAAWWRGVDVWPIVMAIFGVSVVVGIAWGVIRRPTMLDAVMQADQQLQLADLLSSALLSTSGDFGLAVCVMADRACGKHSPSEVMLARYGVRAWSGIGLAWATVIVVGLLAGNGVTSRAEEKGSLLINGMPGASKISSDPFSSSSTARRDVRTPGGREAASDDHSQLGGPADPKQNSATAASSQGKSMTPANAGGQESGSTGQSSVDPTRTALSTNANPTSPLGPIPGGGDGASSASPAGLGESSTGRVAARPADRSAAPWSSDRWPTDRDAALHAVQTGQIPDAYRDLVRDYFTPTVAK